jgi:O-antigen ligase
MISIFSGYKPRLDVASLIFLSFWLYLFLNACVFGNWQIARRLLVILLFIHVCAVILSNPVICRPVIVFSVTPAWFSAMMALFLPILLGELSFSHRATPIEAGFGNPVDAGTFYTPMLVFITWLAVTAKNRLTACGWASCAFALAVLLYVTWSRTAWLTGFVSVALLLFLLAPKAVKKISIWILIAGTTMLLATIERGLTYRGVIWSNIIDRMQGHWLAGHGAGADLGTFSLPNGMIVAHAHNLYLEVLYQYGLSGVALMLIASFTCLVKLFRLRKDRLAVLWFALLVSGMLAMCFAMSNFVGVPNRIWIFYWLPLAGALAMPLPERLHDTPLETAR